MGKLVGSRKCFARGPFGDVDISMVKRENFRKWWKEFASNLSYFLGGFVRFFEPREEGEVIYGIEGFFEVRKRELPEVERRLGYLARVERIVSQFPDVLKWKGVLDPESFQFKFRVDEFEMMLKFPGKCRYFKDEGSFFSLEDVASLPLPISKFRASSRQEMGMSFSEWLSSCRKHFEEELKKLKTSALIKEKQKTKRELVL